MKEMNLAYEILADGTARITKYVGSDIVLEIPSEINGHPVTEISAWAFVGCSSLKSITIPDGITTIGSCAFYGCEGLENVTIPDSVTKIGDLAFCGCSKLKSIIIPDSVTFIGLQAFNSSGLKTKKATYKACRIVNGRFFCRGFEYKVGEWTEPIDKPKLCKRGYHFCENLFDVFNYYCGVIDEDIAIFECDVEGTTNEHNGDSKRVCRSLRLTRRLSRAEIINLLSGKG